MAKLRVTMAGYSQTTGKSMNKKMAKLSIGDSGQTIELPIYQGTLGKDVIDVNAVSELDVFTFDPGAVKRPQGQTKRNRVGCPQGILRG